MTVDSSDHVLDLPAEAGDSQSQDTDEEDIHDNPRRYVEPAGQLEIEEVSDEDSADENTEWAPQRRRQDARWLKSTNFDHSIQSVPIIPNDDLMNMATILY